MELFVLVLLLFQISLLLGSENDINVKINITPALFPLPYRVDDTLNLTCTALSDHALELDWKMPGQAVNSQNRVDIKYEFNSRNLIVRNLQETDSGEYKCTASSNNTPDLISEKTVRINVKQRKKSYCSDGMYSCTQSGCIDKLLVCDGKTDCRHGDDESELTCGAQPCKNKVRCPNGRCVTYNCGCEGNCTSKGLPPCCGFFKASRPEDHAIPCKNKLLCPDGRCVPVAWCCDAKDTNCTSRSWLPCCSYVSTQFSDSSIIYPHETPRYNDVAFFQTTIYTVIGCAMAFMFIVTILVIAICRVHMRRTMVTRCGGRGSNLVNIRSGAQLNSLPFYDLDVILNRSSDVMSVNPLLVTYNINNGVQFVGRPVDPPPYCEIVATPPREGPPPPYASHENLAPPIRRVSRNDEPPELFQEADESDSLLPAPRTISVISNNNIDRSTYVVSLTDDSAGGSPSLTVIETTTTESCCPPVDTSSSGGLPSLTGTSTRGSPSLVAIETATSTVPCCPPSYASASRHSDLPSLTGTSTEGSPSLVAIETGTTTAPVPCCPPSYASTSGYSGLPSLAAISTEGSPSLVAIETGTAPVPCCLPSYASTSGYSGLPSLAMSTGGSPSLIAIETTTNPVSCCPPSSTTNTCALPSLTKTSKTVQVSSSLPTVPPPTSQDSAQ